MSKSSNGVKAIGVACDVSDPAAVQAMTGHVTDELGGIHILHNNAASKTDNPADFFVPFEYRWEFVPRELFVQLYPQGQAPVKASGNE